MVRLMIIKLKDWDINDSETVSHLSYFLFRYLRIFYIL